MHAISLFFSFFFPPNKVFEPPLLECTFSPQVFVLVVPVRALLIHKFRFLVFSFFKLVLLLF